MSASEQPPVTHVQNLTLRTPPFKLQPRASQCSVTIASFHPERPNIFLLAFKDGSIAAYDAIRIQHGKRDGIRRQLASKASVDGEIGSFVRLWTVSNRGQKDPDGSLDDAVLGGYDRGTKSCSIGARAVGITDAAFLPGYSTRAICIGADGKCRLLDFAEGGKVLRTWHVRGPATSLSILKVTSPHGQMDGAKKSKPLDGMKRSRYPTLGPADENRAKNSIIAIGRLDGKVLLYDSIGLLFGEKTVAAAAGRVISVAWGKGAGPRPSKGSEHVRFSDEKGLVDLTPLQKEIVARAGLHTSRKSSVVKTCRTSKVTKLARTPTTNSKDTVVSFDGSTKDMRLHDSDISLKENRRGSEAVQEEHDDTVRHMDRPNVNRDAPTPINGNYMDLFSPVKPAQAPAEASPERAVTRSRPRNRPRISSSTFVDSVPSPTSPTSRGTSLSPTTSGTIKKHREATSPSERTSWSAIQEAANEPDSPALSRNNTMRRTSQPHSARKVLIAGSSNVHPRTSARPKLSKPIPSSARKSGQPSPRHFSSGNLEVPGRFPSAGTVASSQNSSATSATINRNKGKESTEILANLKKLDRTGTGKSRPSNAHRRSGFALFAPYMPKRSKPPTEPSPSDSTHSQQVASSVMSSDMFSSDYTLGDSSMSQDIWVTSESEEDANHFNVRQRKPRFNRREKRSSSTVKPVRFRKTSETSSRVTSSRATSDSRSTGTSYDTFSSSLYSRKQDEDDSDPTMTATYQTAPTTQPYSQDPSSASDVSPGRRHSVQKETTTPLRRRPSVAAELSPGSADSPEGPIDVEDFFPRKSSLVNLKVHQSNSSPVKRSPGNGRMALGEVSGNIGQQWEEGTQRGSGQLLLSRRRRRPGQKKHVHLDIWEDIEGEAESQQSLTSGASSTATKYDLKHDRHNADDNELEVPSTTTTYKKRGYGNQRDQDLHRPCACDGICCGELREELRSLKEEVRVLRSLMQGMIVSTSPQKRR